MSAVLSFGGGLILLMVAAHVVVSAASHLGTRLGLSPMVIGLTIVAAGTSAPELAVVGQAVAADDTELAVGSIIGSNIANVLLVLGIAATLGTIHVASRVVRADIPVMIGASVLFGLLALDGRLGRLDSALMVSALVVFVWWTVRAARRVGIDPTIDDARDTTPPGLIRLLASLVVGIAGLAVAARFVVSGVEEIAVSLGIPELIVGLTLVALGTSAPEIVTTLVAAVRGRRDLAVGNAVGSNIFNLLLVLGTTGLFARNGIAISDDALQLDLPIMVAAAVACLPIVAWDHKLDRWEGALFVAFYIAYVAFLVLDATGHRAKEPFALIMVVFVLPLSIATAATVIHRQRRKDQTYEVV